MGFSRYCPSSLDLPNFVVRICRGAAAENTPLALSWLSLTHAQARFLEIWGLGNPEILESPLQQKKNKDSQSPNVLPTSSSGVWCRQTDINPQSIWRIC